jgi:hypothetical protein
VFHRARNIQIVPRAHKCLVPSLHLVHHESHLSPLVLKSGLRGEKPA